MRAKEAFKLTETSLLAYEEKVKKITVDTELSKALCLIREAAENRKTHVTIYKVDGMMRDALKNKLITLGYDVNYFGQTDSMSVSWNQ